MARKAGYDAAPKGRSGYGPDDGPLVKPLGKKPGKGIAGWKIVVLMGLLVSGILGLIPDEKTPKPKPIPNKDTAPELRGDYYRKQLARLEAQRGVAPDSQIPTRAEARRLARDELAAQAIPPGTAEKREQRRDGLQAILTQFSSNASQAMMQEAARIAITRDPAKPIADSVYDKSWGVSFHIAAAPVSAEGMTNAFICAQGKEKTFKLMHGQAMPDGQGGYKVALSDTMPHPGNYLTGAHLLSTFGQANCQHALRSIHQQMAGTGETAAYESTIAEQGSERRITNRAAERAARKLQN